MPNLMRHLLRRHLRFLLACGLLLCAFELVICAIVSSLDLDAMLRDVGSLLPPFLREALLQRALGGGGIEGLLAFGWNHPAAHAIGASVAIVLGSRTVAGEIESGTLELVLAQPISRFRYLLGHVLFAVLALTLVIASGLAGTVVGERIFDLPPLPTTSLLWVGCGFALLCAALYGVSLLLSSLGREGGRAAAAAFGIALVSFVLQAVATLWGEAAFLLPWSLHGHYDPRAILAGGALPAREAIVLGAVALGAVILAAWRFAVRDLP